MAVVGRGDFGRLGWDFAGGMLGGGGVDVVLVGWVLGAVPYRGS